MSIRIMITSAGGALASQTLLYAKESSRHAITTVGVDMSAEAAGRHFADIFETVPRGDASDYLERVCALVAQHDIQLIVPCSDEEAIALAAGRAQLAQLGCTVACGDVETLKLMADKGATYTALRARGLPAPDFDVAETKDALVSLTEAYWKDRNAFVVKQPKGVRGGRGTFIVHAGVRGAQPFYGGRELEMDYETFKREYLSVAQSALPAIVCERLIPAAFDVDVLAWDGVTLRVVPRRRLNPAGVPYRGYVVEDRPDLAAYGEALADMLNISWLFDFDVMSRMDGTPVIIELNPRPSGSFATAIAAGVPLLDDLVSLAIREDLPEIAPPSRPMTIVPATMLKVVG